MLQLLHYLLQDAQVHDAHLTIVLRYYLVGKPILDGGFGKALLILFNVLLRKHILNGGDAVDGSLLLLPPQVQEGNHLIGGILMLGIGHLSNNVEEVLIECFGVPLRYFVGSGNEWFVDGSVLGEGGGGEGGH